jgi:hypothetical protein
MSGQYNNNNNNNKELWCQLKTGKAQWLLIVTCAEFEVTGHPSRNFVQRNGTLEYEELQSKVRVGILYLGSKHK